MGMAHMDGLEERFVAHEATWEPPAASEVQEDVEGDGEVGERSEKQA